MSFEYLTFEVLNSQLLTSTYSTHEEGLSYENWFSLLRGIRSSFIKGWDGFHTKSFINNISQAGKTVKAFVKTLLEPLDLTDETLVLRIAYKCYFHNYKALSIPTVRRFYENERISFLRCLSSFFRNVVIESPHSRYSVLWEDMCEYLLHNGIEKQSYLMLSNMVMCDGIMPVLSKVYISNLSEGYSRSTMKSMYYEYVRYKFLELSEILDMVFIMYYSKVSVRIGTVIMYTKMFAKYDFGIKYLHIYDYTQRGELKEIVGCVNRVINLQVLVFMELVNQVWRKRGIQDEGKEVVEVVIENVDEAVKTIYLLLTEKMERRAQEKVFGLYCLVFGTFLKVIKYDEDETHIIKDMITSGFQMNGLQFVIEMFDRKNVTKYAFFGHEQNIEAYKDVVKVFISNLLTSVDNLYINLPLKFIQDVVKMINVLLIYPTYTYLKIENHFLQFFFHYSLKNSPYDEFIKFIANLLPDKVEFLKLFANLCYDRESTKYVFELIESSTNFTISMKKDVILSNPSIFQPVQSNKYKLIDDFIPQYQKGDNIELKRNSTIEILFDPSEDDPSDSFAVSFENICGFSIWKSLLSELYDLSRRMVSKEELNNYTCLFDVIRKLFLFGGSEILSLCDDYLHSNKESATSISSSSYTPGFMMIKIVTSIVEMYTSNINIMKGCLKCVAAYSEVNPKTMENFLIHFLSNKYFSMILPIESEMGFYKCVLYILETILNLSKSNTTKPDNLLSLMKWLTTNIFISHNSWKYQFLEQKWIITLRCVRIFTNVIENISIFDNPMRVLNIFFEKNSLCSNVLFTVIGFGHTNYKKVITNEKGDEIALIQKLIVDSLKLMRKILSYRIQHLKHISKLPFEKGLELVFGDDQKPLISVLFQYTKDKHITKIRVEALSLIRRIMQLPNPPSIIQCLGENTMKTIKHQVVFFNKEFEEERYKVAFLKLLSAVVSSNENGLGKMFLHYDLSDKYADPLTDFYKIHSVLKSIPKKGILMTTLSIVTKLAVNENINRELVVNGLEVFRNIFYSRKYDDIIEVLRTDQVFCDGIFSILRYSLQERKKKMSPEDQENENRMILKCVYLCVEIITIDLFHGKMINSLKYTKNMFGEFYNCFYKEANEGVFRTILKNTVNTVKRQISQCRNVVDKMSLEVYEYQRWENEEFNMEDYFSENENEIYDTERLKKREPRCTKVIEFGEIMNEKFYTVDLNIKIIDSIRSMLCIYTVPFYKDEKKVILSFKKIGDFLRNLLNGLEVFDEELPPQVEKIQNLLHINCCKAVLIVLKAISQMMDVTSKEFKDKKMDVSKLKMMIDDDDFRTIIVNLETQLKRGKEDICFQLLSAILFCFTKITNFRLSLSTSFVLNPVLFSCVKTFGQGNKCSNLALFILSLSLREYCSNEDIEYICGLLIHESNIIFVNDKLDQEYIIALLLILLSVAYTDKGQIMLDRNILSSLSNIIKFYSRTDKNMEKNEVWILYLKLVCALMINYDKENFNIFFHNHSQRIMNSVKSARFILLNNDNDQRTITEEDQLIHIIMKKLKKMDGDSTIEDVILKVNSSNNGLIKMTKTDRKRVVINKSPEKPVIIDEKKEFQFAVPK